MEVFLLRHGVAVDLADHPGLRDADRPLTPEGERKLRSAAKGMLTLELSFDRVLTSPLLRARQTAAVVVGVVGFRHELEVIDALVPGADPEELVAHLGAQKPSPEKVLLVGHEPNLSSVIALLVTGRTDAVFNLKKGSLCKLSVDRLRPSRCAALEWLLTAKQLSGLA